MATRVSRGCVLALHTHAKRGATPMTLGPVRAVVERESSSTLEIAVAMRLITWELEVQDDGGPRRVPMPPSRLVFGTAAGCDVVLRDPTVSARHCSLSVHGSRIAIEDL